MASSDDLDSKALTPDQVVERVSIANVDDLEDWEGPYEQDVGAAHQFADVFGAVRIALVQDGKVVYGQDAVQAERQSRRNGGMVPVIDISDLGWSELRAAAAAIGLTRLDQLSRADPATLADILLRIKDEDAGLLLGAGFTDDDLSDILELAANDMPPLDGLAGADGAPGQAPVPPGMGVVQFTAPEVLVAAWEARAADFGDDDAARFAALLGAAGITWTAEQPTAPADPDAPVDFDFADEVPDE